MHPIVGRGSSAEANIFMAASRSMVLRSFCSNVAASIARGRYRLPDAGRGVSAQRLLALDQVGLDVLQDGLELGIGKAVRGAWS